MVLGHRGPGTCVTYLAVFPPVGVGKQASVSQGGTSKQERFAPTSCHASYVPAVHRYSLVFFPSAHARLLRLH